jgi:hypothetical protein
MDDMTEPAPPRPMSERRKRVYAFVREYTAARSYQNAG